MFTIAAFAQLVVGYLIDRYSVRAIFAFVALVQAAFFYVMIQSDGLLSLLVAVAFMLAVFGQIPINDVLVGRMARSEWRSRDYAARYIDVYGQCVGSSPDRLGAWIDGVRCAVSASRRRCRFDFPGYAGFAQNDKGLIGSLR